jgi:hypothetical protein
MAEFLKPDEVLEMPLSRRPYMKVMQVANRLGLMGIRIEDIERTFPLGETDLLCSIVDMELGTDINPNNPTNRILTDTEIDE